MLSEISNSPSSLGIIDSLDFSEISQRLQKGKGWSSKQVDQVVLLYKRFLFLHQKYGQHYQLVPTKEIDEVWHEHILFTRNYLQDCMNLFGSYLHHDPETIAGPEKELAKNHTEFSDQYFNQTQRLYFQEFGEYMEDITSSFFVKLGRLLKNMLKI